MAPYSHHINTYHRLKRARRLKKLSWVVLALIVLILSYIIFDWIRNNLNNNSTVGNSSGATVRSASINIFRTPYFQFQTDKTWRAINEASTDSRRYVYRSYQDILVQHELIVEVDNTERAVLANTQTAYVLPVEIINNNLKTVGTISPHCKSIIGNETDSEQQFIEYKDTEFPCDPDSSVFVAVVGLVGGNEVIEYKTTIGDGRILKITYRDSTFSPNGRPLSSIINSFQIL